MMLEVWSQIDSHDMLKIALLLNRLMEYVYSSKGLQIISVQILPISICR